MKRNRLTLPVALASLLSLTGCGSKTGEAIDDIDLAYYAHHVAHNVYRQAKKARVTIKQLKSDTEKTYDFSGLVWNDDYYWTETEECQDYVADGMPLGYVFTENSILNESLVSGFINNGYFDCVSAMDYFGLHEESRQEESIFRGRIARKNGNILTLITQWCVISFTEKIVHDEEGDEEGGGWVEYENPEALICVSRASYNGERLDRYDLYLVKKPFFRDDDQDLVYECHDEIFDDPMDYLGYRVSFL